MSEDTNRVPEGTVRVSEDTFRVSEDTMRVPEGTNLVSNDTELMSNKSKGHSKTMHCSAKAKTSKYKGKMPENFKIPKLPKKQTIHERSVYLSDFSLNDSGSESEVDFSEGDSHPKRLKRKSTDSTHGVSRDFVSSNGEHSVAKRAKLDMTGRFYPLAKTKKNYLAAE